MDDYVKQLEDSYEELSKMLAKVIPWVPVWEIENDCGIETHVYRNLYSLYGKVRIGKDEVYTAIVASHSNQFGTLEEAKAYIENEFVVPDVK